MMDSGNRSGVRQRSTRTRTVLSTVAAAVGAVLLMVGLTPAASAAGGRTLTVSPASGLQDGQTVTVSGSGFTANTQLFMVECVASASGAAGCDIATLTRPTTDSSGAFTTQFTVHQTFKGHDCSQATCIVQAAEGASPSAPRGTSAPLAFAAAMTSSSTPTPTETSTPAPTETSMTSPMTTTSSSTGAAVLGQSGGTTSQSGSALAYTGTPALPLLAGGAALLLIGGAVVWLSATRRSHAH